MNGLEEAGGGRKVSVTVKVMIKVMVVVKVHSGITAVASVN